jgi:hypothetical protein
VAEWTQDSALGRGGEQLDRDRRRFHVPWKILRHRLAGGLGNDVLTAMLAHETDTTGNFALVALSDQGDDQATFQGTSNGGTPTFGPTGKALLDGGLGRDTLTNNSKPVSKATGFEQVN